MIKCNNLTKSPNKLYYLVLNLDHIDEVNNYSSSICYCNNTIVIKGEAVTFCILSKHKMLTSSVNIF